MADRLFRILQPQPPRPCRDLTDAGETKGVATWGLHLAPVQQALDAQAQGDDIAAAAIMAKAPVARRGRPRLWTEERLEEMKALIAQGASSKLAARALGATPDAVRSAASHHGLKFRRPK
jgi:hypothetical protein